MKKEQRQTLEAIGLDSREVLSLLLLMQKLMIVQVTALEPGWLQNKEKQQSFATLIKTLILLPLTNVRSFTFLLLQLVISFLLPVVIGGECIKVVTDTKLLGVTISSDLSWNVHITEVIKRAAKRLCFLIQLKRARVSRKDLCLVYIRCVRSVND